MSKKNNIVVVLFYLYRCAGGGRVCGFRDEVRMSSRSDDWRRTCFDWRRNKGQCGVWVLLLT